MFVSLTLFLEHSAHARKGASGAAPRLRGNQRADGAETGATWRRGAGFGGAEAPERRVRGGGVASGPVSGKAGAGRGAPQHGEPQPGGGLRDEARGARDGAAAAETLTSVNDP